MLVLKMVYRLVRIVALCVMVVNLHGAAAAGQFSANHNCPSITELDQRNPISVHHAGCCTNLHCCPILAEPPCADAHSVGPSAATPILNELLPFLLVRAFHPPPKPWFSFIRKTRNLT
ncbi:hypothetical protein ACLJYM_27585 [Rhizobium giardinii]|uniref:hypothetical protein n=1 Tax=Rhizobium giardinii TaxID=56731 RepID=UPI0013AF1E64